MVKVISDSTCDLPKELQERFDISILPLHVLLGEREYEDGVEIKPDELYRWSDEHKSTPKTSAPSIDRAVELFRPYLEAGREIVSFCISESMSASGEVMRLAAQKLGASDRVAVIDSANLSGGIALLAIEAALLARENLTAKEIAARIEQVKPRVRTSFVVDTLMYLYRGGRCGGLTAMVGGVLRLHPKIEVVNGEMHPTKKYRGNIDAVIMHYVRDMEAALRAADPRRVFVVHSGCGREVIGKVKEYLRGLGIFREILESRAGGVISSHCGPGTLGVLFLAQEGN